jgi:hypothetical protein
MSRLFYRAVLVAAGALTCTLSHNANALTITFSQDDADYTTSTLPLSSFNPTPSSTSGIVSTTVEGEVPDEYRSPFENKSGTSPDLLSDGGYGIGGPNGPWSELKYTSIQGGGEATYNFTVPEDNLSILWGSPDEYNTIDFYSGKNGGGTLLLSFTGSQLEIQTFGHDLVDFMFSGADFESVVLSSTANAFEFADLTASYVTTPLPGSLSLLAGGFGVIFLLARRKNSGKTFGAATT